MTGETPPAAKGVTEALRCLEELANMPLGISLEEWCRLSGPILAALSTPSSGGLAVKALTSQDGEVSSAANALLNNLWAGVVTGAKSHEENWSAFERRYPGVKRLHDALKAEAALSSLDRTTLPTAEGWQTMDSAPKDGTAIIGSNDDETAYICAWVADDAEGNGDWLAYGSDVVNPRRWIPVPSGKVMIRAFVAPSNGAR